MTTPLLDIDEAARRVGTDHDLLLGEVERHTGRLCDPYSIEGGPLGDFCDSLHDLVAHVCMWDEINLAVLREGQAWRQHWSLDPRWETADAGRRLNRGGVAAGRELPADLLLHRLTSTRDAVLAALDDTDPGAWHEHVGALIQHAMTVPGRPPFWHAALHLGRLPTPAE